MQKFQYLKEVYGAKIESINFGKEDITISIERQETPVVTSREFLAAQQPNKGDYLLWEDEVPFVIPGEVFLKKYKYV